MGEEPKLQSDRDLVAVSISGVPIGLPPLVAQRASYT